MMNDAKSRFFANMDLQFKDDSVRSAGGDLDIEFSITESGRTVANMVTEPNLSMESTLNVNSGGGGAAAGGGSSMALDMMDFSITQSSRSMGDFSYMGGLTESDRGVLLDAFGPETFTLDKDKDDEDHEHVYHDGVHDMKHEKDDVKPPPPPLATPSLPPVEEERSTVAKSTTRTATTTKNNTTTTRTPKSIPVPVAQSKKSLPSSSSSFSQPNSYGSSGSAFATSVLNAAPGTSYGSQAASQQHSVSSNYNHQHPQHSHLFSHTPPTASSYEVSHFGKRPRSSSVSGKLRSASDYLEERGLLDRQTKAILNDLFIIGDSEMTSALDKYEAGDPSALESMIQSGALQNRLPKDLDILGGIDFDFLTVNDEDHVDMAEIEALTKQHPSRPPSVPPPPASTPQKSNRSSSRSQPIPVHNGDNSGSNQMPSSSGTPGGVPPMHPYPGSYMGYPQQMPPPPPHMVSPQHQPQYGTAAHDDGIGELDFAGDFVSDHQYGGVASGWQYPPHQPPSPLHHPLAHAHAHHHSYGGQPHSYGSHPSSEGGSPAYHDFAGGQRSRSNSLFTALLPPPPQQQRHRSGTITSQASQNTVAMQYGEWMQGGSPAPMGTVVLADPPSSGSYFQQQQPPPPHPQGIQVGSGRQEQKQKQPAHAAVAPTKTTSSGLTASLEAEQKRMEREEKRKEKERKQMERKEKKERKQQMQLLQQQQKAKDEEDKRLQHEAEQQHVPGCGRPRSLSDPHLVASTDEFGLMQVERPDGWVGAYSPESRKVRLERFMEKRKHRVWTQSVKYDVRKNFANSRLRVKGRFVKKEDEQMMREMMSMT